MLANAGKYNYDETPKGEGEVKGISERGARTNETMEEKYKIAKIIPIDIYHRDMLLAVNLSVDEVVRVLEKYQPRRRLKQLRSILASTPRLGGRTVSNPDGTLIVYIPRYDHTPYCIATLVHELHHATNCIMKKAGIDFSDTSEEAYTYLLGYLSEAAMAELIPISSCPSP